MESPATGGMQTEVEIVLEIKRQIVLEIHVSSVAHAVRGLQKKHGSPIQSPHDILYADCLLYKSTNYYN